jgi:hypothetical protein
MVPNSAGFDAAGEHSDGTAAGEHRDGKHHGCCGLSIWLLLFSFCDAASVMQ